MGHWLIVPGGSEDQSAFIFRAK